MPRINNLGSMDAYGISDLDEAGATKYYGFIDEIGNWFIMQVTSTTIRYYRGSKDDSYTTAWTNRTSLSYDYLPDIF